ncbi:hypothetical protein K9N68_09240 [Kovacikia minuta CCNUW1]|uniref:hypothetical protein n=1 Tax=Kovacikia minuta TaxID=2931930 RepID=UPI001CCDD3C1|nr:hypothetical protein [Kovacikia minuta]UBF28049.1 hypothetical protein K9N68_09240 [Kovacikia minuta CCNUW1]
MNLEALESQTRDIVEQTLTQLQTAALLVSELETRIAQAGQSVQELSQLVETFVAEQRDNQLPE